MSGLSTPNGNLTDAASIKLRRNEATALFIPQGVDWVE
jgi:hypothetical protein